MLHAELACQQFDRTTGVEGQCMWPLVDFNFEDLVTVLGIPNTFVLTRRRNARITGQMVFGIGNLPLLQTMLKFWQRRRSFARVWLEILKSDPESKQEWSLHLRGDEEGDLPQTEPQVCHGEALLDLDENHIDALFDRASLALVAGGPVDLAQLFDPTVPLLPIERVDPAQLFDLSRPDLGAETLTLTDDDVERLVSNLGQEDVLL